MAQTKLYDNAIHDNINYEFYKELETIIFTQLTKMFEKKDFLMKLEHKQEGHLTLIHGRT